MLENGRATPGSQPAFGSYHSLLDAISAPSTREVSFANAMFFSTRPSPANVCLPIKLTTVRVPRHQIGQEAGRYLTRQLEADGDFKRQSVKLPFELVIGAST